MEEVGFCSIEVVKINGFWLFLDVIEVFEVFDDLMVELVKYFGVGDYFVGLSKLVKKMLLYWVVFVKRLVIC